MGFADAVRTCLRQYANFSGRASRPEYWYFILFVLLGGLILGRVDAALFGDGGQGGPLGALFSLAMLIPSLAAGWRRMHDTGRSGLFVLYPLIVMTGIGSFVGFMAGFEALLGGNFGAAVSALGGVVTGAALVVLALSPLMVLWWLTRPGQPGSNAWGPRPRA